MRKIRALFVAGVMTMCSVAPSWAELIYDFTFFAPTQQGLSASGGGNFTILDKPSVDLSDLTSFFFDVTVTGSGQPGIFVYTLSDVASFSAILSSGSMTSLTLLTNSVSQANGDNLLPRAFSVSSLGPDGAQSFVCLAALCPPVTTLIGTITVGLKSIPEPVTEPASFALLGSGLLAGLLAIGVIRPRRHGSAH